MVTSKREGTWIRPLHAKTVELGRWIEICGVIFVA